MVQSKATTVAAYLKSLPPDRSAALQTVREVILKNLDKEYEEGMLYGMIGYFIPHRIYPAGYHVNPALPLSFAGLASQKNHMSLYMMGVYCGCGEDMKTATPLAKWFREAWVKAGKKVDMGKACIRFKKVDDLALDVIGEAIARQPARKYIAHYEGVRAKITPRKRKK